MRSFLTIALVILLFESCLALSPIEKTFNQRLDHFSHNLSDKWKQRYWVMEPHSIEKDTPVFLYLGGESEETSADLKNGFYGEISTKAKALRVLLEHRFYGKSIPTQDLSAKNLRYLSVKQAVRDIEAFVHHINQEFNLTSSNKWVTIGCSYPGSLAALARVKYPELIHSAFASSAPVRFKPDNYEYSEVLSRVIDSYNESCTVEVSKAHEDLYKLIRNFKGRKVIRQLFNTCTSLENPRDRIMFGKMVFNTLCSLQYKTHLKLLCDHMIGAKSFANSPLRNLAEAIKAQQEDTDCFYSSYNDFVKFYQSTDTNFSLSWQRLWMYQNCYELGYFLTTNSKNQAFGRLMHKDNHMALCREVFGIEFTPSRIQKRIRETARFYQSDNFNASRILFAYGTLDPWSPLSFKSNRSDLISLAINGSYHCQDFAYPSSSVSIRQALDHASDILLNKWLKSDY